jgi:hypothetical protein
MLHKIKETTELIYRGKYPQARVIFLAGSLIRGEGTATSDLDLVVIFDQIPRAHRESFIFNRWPVEAFVHDPQTLEYFFREIDRTSGFPSLPTMVHEGIEIPQASELSNRLKHLAKTILDEGPPRWSEKDLNNSRYEITDLIDDLRDPRSTQELHATATLLYPTLANHYFRGKGEWSAKGKALSRRLSAIDTDLADRFHNSFRKLFSENSVHAVIELAEEILEPYGGLLFDGYKLEAPKTWRIINPATK